MCSTIWLRLLERCMSLRAIDPFLNAEISANAKRQRRAGYSCARGSVVLDMAQAVQ
jgi:hypothetical protein